MRKARCSFAVSLKRRYVLAFFQKLQPCRVGMARRAAELASEPTGSGVFELKSFLGAGALVLPQLTGFS
jgi:hypothetical protein